MGVTRPHVCSVKTVKPTFAVSKPETHCFECQQCKFLQEVRRDASVGAQPTGWRCPLVTFSRSQANGPNWLIEVWLKGLATQLNSVKLEPS